MRLLNEESEDLAHEFALGLCEGAELARAQHMMSADPAFASAVNTWRQRLVEIDLTAPQCPVPAQSWAHIEAALSGVGRTQSRRASPSIWDMCNALWNSLTLWRPVALAACLALSVGLGTWLLKPPAAPQHCSLPIPT